MGKQSFLLLAALAGIWGCAERPALEIYDVELREKTNTCRELDPQVARESIFVERFGRRAIMHLGAELAFPVEVTENGLRSEFLETDHTMVAGRHVVCKRLTIIDLAIEENRIRGTYERRRRQECLLDAKPCSITWSVAGERRQAKE